MNLPTMIFAVIVVAAVVVGSLFTANYYSSQDRTVDTYGGAPSAHQNETANMIGNTTATGTTVESGLLIFLAVLIGFSFVAYYALKKR